MKMLRIALLSPILMLVVFASCSSNPEDITVADLSEPCQSIDAMKACLDAAWDIVKDDMSPEDVSNAEVDRLKAIEAKLKEIDTYSRKQGWPRKPDCPNSKEISPTLRRVEKAIYNIGLDLR